MGNQPVIPTTAGKGEKVCNAISILFLVGTFLYVLIVYPSLPTTIPSHFDIHGNVDGTSHKAMLFLLPGIDLLVVFIPMYFLGRFPHVFNYPVKVTEENAPRLYKSARLFMAVINMEIVLIFSGISLIMIRMAKGFSGIGTWGIITIVMVLVVTCVILLIRMNQLK